MFVTSAQRPEVWSDASIRAGLRERQPQGSAARPVAGVSSTARGIGCNLRADSLNLLLQLGEVLLNHRPHLVQVEAEVLVDQDFPKRDDLWPLHFRTPVLDAVG